MRQKDKNDRNQGQMLKKNFLLVLFLSPLTRWVRLVQKTRAKNYHAWAPLRVRSGYFHNLLLLVLSNFSPLCFETPTSEFRASLLIS